MYTRTETDALGNTVTIFQASYLLADGKYALLDDGSEVPEGATAVAVIPPTPPTYQQELLALNAEWQKKVDGHNRSFAIAALSDGPSGESKKATIRAAYEADKAQNAVDRAALKAKHGIGGV